MDTIWKFTLSAGARTILEMPIGAQVLDIQFQGQSLQLWALVDPDAKRERREFLIYGTGHPIAGYAGTYIATVQMPPFVWHVFDLGGVA